VEVPESVQVVPSPLGGGRRDLFLLGVGVGVKPPDPIPAGCGEIGVGWGVLYVPCSLDSGTGHSEIAPAIVCESLRKGSRGWRVWDLLLLGVGVGGMPPEACGQILRVFASFPRVHKHWRPIPGAAVLYAPLILFNS